MKFSRLIFLGAVTAILFQIKMSVAGDDISPGKLLPLNDNTAAPHMGLYENSPPKGITEVDDYAKALNRSLMWGHCSTNWDTWGNIDTVHWLWPAWSKWITAKSGRRLVISLAIIPTTPKGQAPITLEQAAGGAFNDHFTKLAGILVQQGLGESIIRLGWEWDGNWYPWGVKTAQDAANYAGAWKQIVTAMKSVPGAEKLQFCWNGAGEKLKFPMEAAYPGDEYVDYVGLDIYDKTWVKGTYPLSIRGERQRQAGNSKEGLQVFYDGDHGIKAWCDFAKSHHKGFMVPEWGLCQLKNGHGGGDNPYFVQQMYNFIQDPANNVYEAAYWDAKESKLIPTGGMTASPCPNAWALFQKLFSLPADATAATP